MKNSKNKTKIKEQTSISIVVDVTIRPYKETDLTQLIQVYQSAFAEPPWNEYMKCVSCGVEYGRREVDELGITNNCKKCNKPLNLIEYWSEAEILEDIRFTQAQPNPIVLIAENGDGIAGMTWGYRIPFDKFPFLEGKISVESSYIDEIAVRGDKRIRGIGTLLGKAYIKTATQQGHLEIVLRTDERNNSSMALFRKLDFSEIPDRKSQRGKVYDPQFPNRIYLKRRAI